MDPRGYPESNVVFIPRPERTGILEICARIYLAAAIWAVAAAICGGAVLAVGSALIFVLHLLPICP